MGHAERALDALIALLEVPTPEMVAAAMPVCDAESGPTFHDEQFPAEVWPAMLQAVRGDAG